MFQRDYNNENINTLGGEIKILNLPNFKGVTKLARELDENGKVKLDENGKPIKLSIPQLIIKCGDLTPQQELDLIAVIDANPTRALLLKSDETLLANRKKALHAEWSDAFALLDDILANGIDDVNLRRNAIKNNNPKPT